MPLNFSEQDASKLEAIQQLLSSVLESVDNTPESLGSRAADYVANVVGSWKFLIIQGCILVAYMIVNQAFLVNNAFDPYPFILLNLVLSFQAAFTAPIILMASNRSDAKDRKHAKKAYTTIGHIEELVQLMAKMEDIHPEVEENDQQAAD